jgi:protein-S-isoprenylcysteine O-methyltransferase Ste14
MIMHRALRDNAKCHDRYGKAWETYTKKVPYIFIPVGRSLVYNSLNDTNQI